MRLSVRLPAAGAAPAEAHTGTHWRRRAGRADGPDTYLCGDLSAVVLRRACLASSRERDETYGGAALLVGVIEATLTGAGVDDAPVACALAALDEVGREVKADRRVTRAAPLSAAGAAQWDEVHALGERAAIGDAKAVRCTLQRAGTFGSADVVGDVTLPLATLRDSCDADVHGFTDAWYTVLHPKKRSPVGRLRLALLLHVPPRDPTPLSVCVRLVEGRNLRATGGDAGGGVAAYARLAPLSRGGEPQLDAADGGRRAELRSSTRCGTHDACVWNERFVLYDGGVGGEDGVRALLRVAAAAATAAAAPPDPTEWPPPVPVGVTPSPPHAADARRALASPLDRVTSSFASGWNALRGGRDGSSAMSAAPPPARAADGGGPPGAAAAAATGKVAACVPLGDTRTLSVTLHGHAHLPADDDLGCVSLSLSSLFGDEDAVLTQHTLRVDKWFRVAPHGSLGPATTGSLGHVRLDVTLLFAESLLPPGWTEAVDDASGETYYHHRATGVSTWVEPPAVAAMGAAARDGGGGGGGGGGAPPASSASFSGAADLLGGLAGTPPPPSSVLLGSPPSAASSLLQSARSHPLLGGGGGGGGDAAWQVSSSPPTAAGGAGVIHIGQRDDGGSAASLDVGSGAGPGAPPPRPAATSDGGAGDGAAAGKRPPLAPRVAAGGGAAPPAVRPAAAAAAATTPGGAGAGGAATSSRRNAQQPAHDGGSDGEGGGGNGDGDDDDDDGAPRGAPTAADVAAAEAAAGFGPRAGGKGGDVVMSNPMAMRAEAAAKKAAETAAAAARLAAMTPEERAAFEQDQQRQARREQRRDRVLLSTYGAASPKKLAAIGGRARAK